MEFGKGTEKLAGGGIAVVVLLPCVEQLPVHFGGSLPVDSLHLPLREKPGLQGDPGGLLVNLQQEEVE